MDRGPDTFARFITVLSSHLADPELGTDALAARLFLSRSQVDRVVAAVAGETPARLRQRILPERAAYRLRTTRLSVLAVAVEAGFSSHEVFTRAFRRHFGAAPAAWRSAGATFHLPAPSGVHFCPPGGLRLPARRGLPEINLVTELVEHHLYVLGQLLDRAAGLPERELDFALPDQAIDRAPTIRALLARLVGQVEMWRAAMANQPYDLSSEQGESLAALRERLDRHGPGFLRYVREVGEQGRHDETFVDTTGAEPYVFTAAGMIAHVLTYAAYRRTGSPRPEPDIAVWFGALWTDKAIC